MDMSRLAYVAIPTFDLIVIAIMNFENVIPAIRIKCFDKAVSLFEQNLMERDIGAVEKRLKLHIPGSTAQHLS